MTKSQKRINPRPAWRGRALYNPPNNNYLKAKIKSIDTDKNEINEL